MNEQEFFDKIRMLVNEVNPEAVDTLIKELREAGQIHPSWDTITLDKLISDKQFCITTGGNLGLVWCAWCKKYLRIEIASEDHDKLALVGTSDGLCAVCKAREIEEAKAEQQKELVSHSKEQDQVEGGDLMSPPSNSDEEINENK